MPRAQKGEEKTEYPRTPSGNPRQAVAQFVRSKHFFLFPEKSGYKNSFL